MTGASIWRDRIVGFRKKHALTQADAAERLKVSQQTISRWESGKQEPDPSAQAILREHLGMVSMTLRESWIQRVNLSSGRDYLFERGWRCIALSKRIEEAESFIEPSVIGKSLFDIPLYMPLKPILEPCGLFDGDTNLVRLKLEFHLPGGSAGRIFDLWPVLTGTDEVLVHGMAYPFAPVLQDSSQSGLKIVETQIIPRNDPSHKSA